MEESAAMYKAVKKALTIRKRKKVKQDIRRHTIHEEVERLICRSERWMVSRANIQPAKL